MAGARFLMLVVAGAIAGLSVPPLFVLPAIFVALPFWVWALDGAERRTGIGRIFRAGLRHRLLPSAVGYFTVAFHWLAWAFLLEGGPLYLTVMPFAILALAALIALFWGLASSLAHLFWSHGAWRIVALATFLSAAEYARGTLFSGFFRSISIGYSLTATPEMMQLAFYSDRRLWPHRDCRCALALTPALILAGGRCATSRPRLLRPSFSASPVIAAQIGWGHLRLHRHADRAAHRHEEYTAGAQPMITEHANWVAVPATLEIVSRLIELSTGSGSIASSTRRSWVWPESGLSVLR